MTAVKLSDRWQHEANIVFSGYTWLLPDSDASGGPHRSVSSLGCVTGQIFMLESLSGVLVANGLVPDSFTACAGDEKIFRGELPAGRVVETWMKLAGAASETKYWPTRCSEPGDSASVDNRGSVGPGH